ncbi:uncharacterized protein TRUGW13939_00844 [Talaromyces rugulosus]|uniref:Uncharacterized protein n=1 Tax=Talaromyces rugulosus TaxID=121627 RepID=A0A7H8QIF5_TALRU|nr:uncharacterized protein TRUGW13939_00844 [Talaromyces rugulosus]QKX53764.1 hypothetical protein TRUGW13939_00844 [Talaromyces rugulosus]
MGMRHQLPGETYEEFQRSTMSSSGESSASVVDTPGFHIPGADSPDVDSPDVDSPDVDSDAYSGPYFPASIPSTGSSIHAYDPATMSDSEGEECIDDKDYFLDVYGQITDIRRSLATTSTPNDVGVYEGRTRSHIISSELRGVKHDLSVMLKVLFRSRWNQLVAVGSVSEDEPDVQNRVTQREHDDVKLDLACIEYEYNMAPDGRVAMDEEVHVRIALDRLYGQPDLVFFQREIQDAPPEVIRAFNRRSKEKVYYFEHHSDLNTLLIQECDGIITEWLQPIMDQRRVTVHDTVNPFTDGEQRYQHRNVRLLP